MAIKKLTSVTILTIQIESSSQLSGFTHPRNLVIAKANEEYQEIAQKNWSKIMALKNPFKLYLLSQELKLLIMKCKLRNWKANAIN